ncbi:hypothetical protein BaRGS_00001136 [Batillaria attramentaria]|uniref:DUF3719 domain-containing protein n=1 Tax=Batillaria attramentaria TaxID=370345 RepID=A0ABD0M6Y4_9CAEN
MGTRARQFQCYNTTPTSSGRSSPTNVDTQSTVSQGGWTTGNTTERSSLDSSCYSLDEFDRQAASTVNQHFEEFESLLYEGARDTGSSIHRECQEWSEHFPHLRVLGKQVVAPKDTGFHFVSPTSSSTTAITPRPSTSGTLDLNLPDHDLSFSSDSQGLTLSGRKVKASKAPAELTGLTLNREPTSSTTISEYDFLHEEVFAQDGVYEDIIAVDYKNIYEDNMEHKKQITPRRRRVGYPPITPNACVKDSVSSGAFDSMWHEIMSWMRSLLKRYAAEVVDSKKTDEVDYAYGHARAPSPPFRAPSFVSQRPLSKQGTLTDANMSFDGVLNVSRMALRERNAMSSEQPDSPILMNPSLLQQKPNRPATVHPQTRHLKNWNRRLEPLAEPAKHLNMDESKNRQSPHDLLHVRPLRLASPPTPLGRHLPPLESSPAQSNRRGNYRVSSAIDNKEGRSIGRERSNNPVEASRPSTTQAFRSDAQSPYGGIGNRRSSTPLGQSVPGRSSQMYLMQGNRSLGVTGSGIHPSQDAHQHMPSNILEDHEGPLEDIRHNQWSEFS